ncbi:MAG: hypothetical protein HY344_04810 [Candidatus Levybacteria bacterium]|nr:hypothetical protein [Candidatus Levybacteria bacterium]
MKNLFLVCLLIVFSLFLFCGTTSFAQEKIDSSNAISTQSASVNYQLAWPGMLPDNPLYKLKVLRDKIMSKLVSDPIKKIEWDLIMADKTIYASLLLLDKGNIALAKETALKGEHYFTILVTDYKWAFWRHQGITQELDERIKTAALKHQEIFDKQAYKVSQKDKKAFQDANYFSKLNYQTILDLKIPKDKKVK